jgi:hypothetical protein
MRMTVVILWVGALVAIVLALVFVSSPPHPQPLWTGDGLGGVNMPVLQQTAHFGPAGR